MQFTLKIGGRDLIVEIRGLASQANGEVLVRYGDTTILVTCVMANQASEDLGFFPLTVDYEERYYAAGKIFGPRYIKRESRPADEAILSARLIDRAIRPCFPKALKRAVQVIITCLSWDGQNDPDILGLLGASIALALSDIPWDGPLATLRIGQTNGQFIINPTYEERAKGSLDLTLTGKEKEGQILLNMLEVKADEAAEETILQAVERAEDILKQLLLFQKQIQEKLGKPKMALEPLAVDEKLEKEIRKFLGERLEKALWQKDKGTMAADLGALKEELISFVESRYEESEKIKYAKALFEREMERMLHENIIKKKQRLDGRKLDEMRPLACEVGVLPRTHGSALFSRGQTKALSILTLGAPGDQQILEGMEIVGKKRFMHHYNFPPYSTGEIKPLRGPARRDIGHGMLVEKALLSLIPSFEEFPYTMRVVSEILSSNGSTSMASVSSSSLALMDAGVPLKRPAAGIALGLMQDETGQYEILTDIQGPEDHQGNMDTKVAGTRKGITALQMDVKVAGITRQILGEVLERGKKARLEILDTMDKVLAQPRPKLSPYAPCLLKLRIAPEKIGGVIGPGGRVIRGIIEQCGVNIDVQDDGLIFITSESEEAAKKALALIKNITREVKIGEVFEGKVKKIVDFGAFVEIVPGQEGLIHISELAPYRVKRVEQILKIGQSVPVQVISIDEQGRINLSLQKTRTKKS